MKTMTVTLSEEEFSELEELSEYEGECIEGAIRLAIRQYKYNLRTFYGTNDEREDVRRLTIPFAAQPCCDDEIPF